MLIRMGVVVAVFSHVLSAGDARALSCHLPRAHGFFQCEDSRCEPLFQARFRLIGDGCRGRWITETMEADVAASLLSEVDRRELRVDGQLDVEFSLSSFGLVRAMPGEEWALEAYLQEMKINTVPGSPTELRETWDAKASDGLWTMVQAQSVGWAWAFALFAVLYLTACRVWSAFRRGEGRRGTLALALTVQALSLLFGWFAVRSAQLTWSNRLDAVGLVVLLGAALFVVELLALAVRRLRGALRSV